MTESQRLADQLQRAFTGEAWHGPSLHEALAGVTAAMALARPIDGAHSIWELTAHIAAWEDVVLRRINGEVVADPPEGDFPAPPPHATEGDWAALLTNANNRHATLAALVTGTDADALNSQVPGKQYQVWFMAHGAVSHALYHTGQIVLLKRALS